MIQRVAVYCGSKKGISEHYQSMATKLGKVLVDSGIELVYGGGKVGLMGVVADAVIADGGRVTGVIPHGLCVDELVHQNLTELVTVVGMHERKAKMIDLADAFIAMPGGIGTMDELFEVWTWYQLGIHSKPVGILNVEGYFDGLIEHLHQMVTQEFLSQRHLDSLHISHSPFDLISQMQVSERELEAIWVADEK
ncbi:MAG: TIGR00730 family Rossman fold protein [Proteobacteria bacterium]|nr:TIGR00730 family Rossman fold protein [Pseudomonadota bacterium]MDA1011864.1 TIGR00730 family Rossman fold protein [Pseudomonadota bacterium]